MSTTFINQNIYTVDSTDIITQFGREFYRYNKLIHLRPTASGDLTKLDPVKDYTNFNNEQYKKADYTTSIFMSFIGNLYISASHAGGDNAYLKLASGQNGRMYGLWEDAKDFWNRPEVTSGGTIVTLKEKTPPSREPAQDTVFTRASIVLPGSNDIFTGAFLEPTAEQLGKQYGNPIGGAINTYIPPDHAITAASRKIVSESFLTMLTSSNGNPITSSPPTFTYNDFPAPSDVWANTRLVISVSDYSFETISGKRYTYDYGVVPLYFQPVDVRYNELFFQQYTENSPVKPTQIGWMVREFYVRVWFGIVPVSTLK